MIYLLHIPKTAGQTLALRLAAGFPPERVSVLRQDVPDAGTLRVLAGTHDLVAGHPGGAVLADPPAGLEVMTVVRDPAAQVVSHWRHIRREAHHPLHQASRALPPAAFLERFAHHLLDFQARTLVAAFRMPSPADRVRGIEYWLLRHLEGALDGLRWIAPLECLDEFCALWSLETGRPMGSPDMRANAAGPGAEEGPAGALRAWLLAHAHRHAIDGVLWNLAQQRFADWRHRLFTRGTDGGAPPLPGQQACAGAEGAGVWLMRDVHPSSLRGDGVTEWWIGPGFFALMRVRRGGHAVLRFAAPAFLGVRWDRVRILRRRDLVELPLQRQVEEATRIVHYTADLAGLGPDEELVLYAPEDVSVLPAVPLAWDMPRRGFATQGWELA